MGAVFGGGASATVFGGRGAANFLTRLTTASAVIFMLTSFGLSYTFTQASSDRLFDGEVPAEETAPAEAPLFEQIDVAPPIEPAPAAEPAPEAAEAPTAPEAALPDLPIPGAEPSGER